MSKLILLRHGQSEWNKKNIFTGWIDIPLSTEGIEEALRAGRRFASIPIDLIYTSELERAIMTAFLAMSLHESKKVCVMEGNQQGPRETWARCHSKKSEEMLIPMRKAWQLNERYYGVLQGQNKDEIRAQFGAEQVQIWRRSFDIAPPEGESLQMTAARTLPYFDQEIVPQLASGKNVLISAHGNSLRSIVMELDGLSEEEVINLEIPTGQPLLYLYESGQWRKDALL